MDRNREVRRANIVGANGFNRRRHRTNSLRDSPDEDAAPELQESGRLRDRLKKDRDRERERERDLREKSSRNKRRGDETSEEESLNDDEDDDGDEENAATAGGGGGVRLLTQAAVSVNHHDGHVSNHHHNHSSSFSQHNNSSTTNTVSSNHHHHLQHRKSYPPNPSSVKVSRPPPVWRSSSEMIGSLVPRKRRSASTKRSHDWMSMEQNLMQPWSSPPRQSAAAPATTPAPPHPPLSPTSSNASVRKKLKPTANNSGQKVKPAKAAAKPSANSSNPEELEIEIAEVLYGLMTQSQAPSSKKEESRDAKSRNSSPISNSSSANYAISGSNSAPLSAVAPKRKRPREMPENSISGACSSIPAKPDADQVEKTLVSAAENGYEMAANSVDPLAPAQVASELTKIVSEAKPAVEELMASRDSLAKEEVSSSKEKESPAVKADVGPKVDSPPAVTSSSVAPTTKASTVAAMENRKEEKFEIDLMAPPPQARPSPEREAKTDRSDPPADKKQTVSISDANLKPDENGMSGRAEEKKGQEVESNVDLEKSERDGGDAAGNGNKSQSSSQKPLTEKSGHSASSLPLPMSIGSWPNGLPPMGYMAPMQGAVSMEGGPGHIPPRPKRCATHCHIARNIHYLQQLMKINPFWPPPAAASASLFGSKPNDKAQNVAKEKISSQPATTPDSAQRKQQQQQPILIQQAMPPMGPSNLMGPAFIFPLNQQQQSAASRPSGAKSPSAGISSSTTAVTSSSTPAAAVSFNYPTMASNETPYLAIVQNNGFPYPVPAAPSGYRGTPGQKAMPFPFYSAQMIHPSQLQSQLLQPHQNATASTAASASQKQQPRGQNAGVSAASPSPSLSSQKTQPGREEDSPSTTDSRGSRASNMNIYGQNFTMPNFGLMTHPATTASSNHTDKKGQSKTTPDSLPPHSFAMTFGTMNGITSDMAAQNHAIFQKKNSRASDDGKSGGVEEDERKSTSGKVLSGGQSIAFAKSNPMNAHTHNNIQAQLQHQMQQQLKHHHQQQQQQQMAVNRSKVAVNSNGSMYSEHLNLNTSSKFPSIFQQNLVQSSGSSSPSQSPQWKASARASSTTPSTTTTTTTPLKNLPQQQQQQQRTQISFGGNQTSSPTTSSVSKGAAASGSPRTSSASTTNKTTPASLPAQPPNHKSPSILGNPKPSQSQQQIPKPMQQQQQLFFSNPYAQPGKSSSASYYMTRTASGGGLSLSTNDPATAIAAATANVKQFGAQPVLPAGFSYAHPVQVKGSGEQKQAAGNESLHQWQPEKK